MIKKLIRYKLVQSDGVFIFKNINTTIGFVRFNNLGEIEYIFVNPIFRKKSKKILRLVKGLKDSISKTNQSFRIKTSKIIRK